MLFIPIGMNWEFHRRKQVFLWLEGQNNCDLFPVLYFEAGPAPSMPVFNVDSGKDTLRRKEKEKEKKKTKGKSSKLTKDDIGTPTNFR